MVQRVAAFLVRVLTHGANDDWRGSQISVMDWESWVSPRVVVIRLQTSRSLPRWRNRWSVDSKYCQQHGQSSVIWILRLIKFSLVTIALLATSQEVARYRGLNSGIPSPITQVIWDQIIIVDHNLKVGLGLMYFLFVLSLCSQHNENRNRINLVRDIFNLFLSLHQFYRCLEYWISLCLHCW